MTEADPIDEARELATEALAGHDGIVGVGRTAETLVFFVTNRTQASPVVKKWMRKRSVRADIKDVGEIRPATGLRSSPVTGIQTYLHRVRIAGSGAAKMAYKIRAMHR